MILGPDEAGCDPCGLAALAGLLLGIPLLAYVAGVRIVVVKPIGAVPEGRTVVVYGPNGLNFVDSPDAFCLRRTGSVTLLCRGAALAGIVNNSTILARLPYSSALDAIAGTPATDR